MSEHKSRDRMQNAALPFRMGADGRPEVLLLISRETKRWVIPKGWPMHAKKPREVTAREAFEEAVLLGSLNGNIHYAKELASGESILCQVKVFLLLV
jgi:8-oxo-dGTP pyrophosphatase MutT (NUDIX family)